MELNDQEAKVFFGRKELGVEYATIYCLGVNLFVII